MTGRLVLLIMVALLAACSKPKTEAQQYEELRDSFKYKTYSSLSRSTLPGAIHAVNNNTAENSVDDYTAHLAMAFFWAVSKQPDLAIAESHLAGELANNPQDKFIAGAVRAIGMHEKGWRTLASAEVEASKQQFKTLDEKNRATETLTVAYAVLGVYSLYAKDMEQATVAFRGLDTLAGIGIPLHLTLALEHIQKARFKEAKAELQLVINDPTLPSGMRDELIGIINNLEKEYGSMDSGLFIPRLVGKSVWAQISTSTRAGLRDLSAKLDKFSSGIN